MTSVTKVIRCGSFAQVIDVANWFKGCEAVTYSHVTPRSVTVSRTILDTSGMAVRSETILVIALAVGEDPWLVTTF